MNALNQPWVAIIVIVIGMLFDIICKRYGVSNDAATGVIGAGVGLLTGQAISKLPQEKEIGDQHASNPLSSEPSDRS